MPNGPKCCVIHGCKNTQDSSKGISIHRFPTDMTIHMKWVEFINSNRERKGIPEKVLTSAGKNGLCSIHFEDSEFSNKMQYNMGFAKRKKLKKEAIPRIYEVSCEPSARKINGEKVDKGIMNEEFPILQKNISLGELVKNLDNDIKIEEMPICDKNTIIDQQDKQKLLIVDSGDHRYVNAFQIPTFSLARADEKVDKDNLDGEFPMLQKNISVNGLVESLDNDIKIEELPICDDKDTVIDQQDKQKIHIVDSGARREVNAFQIPKFSLFDSTNEILENMDELKQISSGYISLNSEKHANENIDNIKYTKSKYINSECDKFENPTILELTSEEVAVHGKTPKNHKVLGNTHENYNLHQNKLDNGGVIRNAPENYEILGSIPEYTMTNKSQISFMIKDDPIHDEPSVCKLGDSITKYRSQKGYKDKILMATSLLQNDKDISELDICQYICEHFAHEGKNEEVIYQLVSEDIKVLISTGIIFLNGNRFEINSESFLEMNRKYEDLILEAIAASTDPRGSDLSCIRNYIYSNEFTCTMPFIKRCVDELISKGYIIQIGSRLKVSNISSEVCSNVKNINDIENGTSNAKRKKIEHKFDNKDIEKLGGIRDEYKKNQEKSMTCRIVRENVEKIAEKENSRIQNTDFEHEFESDNYEELEEEDYRTKLSDIILSEEMEIKNNRNKIFNQDNYVDCPIIDCDLIVFGDHIENHLHNHESNNTKMYNIKMNDKRTFACTECNEKYVTFYSIANHIFNHFKDKTSNERVCNGCGYKNKRLTAFKNHKCNILQDVVKNNSKALIHEDHLESNNKTSKKKGKRAKMNDEEYNPSDDNNYSSDNDCGDSDDEKQNIIRLNNNMLAKLNVTCTRCQEKFENEALCKDHLKIDHDVDIVENSRQKGIQKEVDKKAGIAIYMCLKCKKIFHNIKACMTHISVKHHDIAYHCAQCEYVSCRNHLLLHIKRKHKHEISQCKICNRPYKNKEKLRLHMLKTHHNNPHKKCLCNICGKVFRKNDHLNIHLLIHKGEKPFACKLCKFSTVQKYNLVVHMRSHERGTIKPIKK